MKKDGALWSWFMPWYHDYTLGYHNQVSTWQELFNSDIVIKVKDLPNWKNYQIQSPVAISPLSSNNKKIKIVYLKEGILKLETPEGYNNISLSLYSLSGELKVRSFSNTYFTKGKRIFNINTRDIKKGHLFACM